MKLQLSSKVVRIVITVVISLALIEKGSAQAPSAARKVLDDMIAALGGQTFLDVKEIHTAGRFFSFSRGELTGGDLFVDYIKFPDSERTEFGKEKNKSITINKGAEGWLINEKEKKVEPQPATQAEEFALGFKTSFDYVTRFVLNLPRTTVQNVGTQFIDFKRTDVIEVRDPDKSLIRFFIDRDSRLPVKMQVRRVDETVVREEQFGNWHLFEGVMTPLFLSRYSDGVKTMEIRTETAVYNSGLAESLFTPPPAK